jgi:hypothetical protein
LLALESLDTQGKRQDVATEAFPAETLHRVDRQLLNMIDDARERLNDEPYPVDDGIHMDGFSAAAAFSTRFGLLYPNRVKSISAGGGGAAPLPFSSRDGVTLPYPLGIADYQDWTGRSFDREAWTSIDQFIYVGEEDQPLPDEDPRRYRPYSDRYQDRAEEVYGINSVTEKLPTTRSAYDEVGANAEFKIYEGVGHRTTPESRQDVLQFHRRTLDAEHVLQDLFEFTTLRRSASQIEVGSPVTVTVGIRNRFSATATAVVTFYIDGENIKTVERLIEPNGSTELTFEHTFEEPGSYTLSINNQQIGEEPLAVTDPTPTPTPTSTPTATSTPTVQSPETTSTTGPGFGVGAALAGVASLGYLLKREEDD